MTTNKTSAILLAAGFSSRMGKLKALLPWGGMTLIEYIIEQMQQAGMNEIIVVLGHEAEELREVVSPYEVTTIYNENFAHGKSTSIQKGASCLRTDTEGILISAVDQPVASDTLQMLVNSLHNTKAKIVIPVYEGKRGHPIFIHYSLKNDLLNVNEKTQGLRHVIHNYHAHIEYVDVDNPNILLNLNRPEDYFKLSHHSRCQINNRGGFR